MPPWAWYDWLLRIAGGLIMAIGLGIALWALRGDPARGRKRCPKCWYDMSGIAATVAADGVECCTCPECGRQIASAHGLLRTRRRWKLAAWCVLYASVGWQIGWMGTPGREGLKAFVPTVVLIVFEQDFAEAQKSKRVLWVRLADGIMTPWDRWLASMRELHASEIDWDALVSRREKWPVGQPVRIRLNIPWQAASSFESRSIVIASNADAHQFASVLVSPRDSSWVGSASTPEHLELPPPSLGVNRYELIVQIRGHHGGSRSKCVTIEVEGVPSLDDVVTPDTDTAVTMKIATRLGWRLEHHGTQVFVIVTMVDGAFASSRKLSILFNAKLYRGGELISEAAGSTWGASRPMAGLSIWQWSPGDGNRLGPESIDLTDVWLELTPAPEAAIESFYVDSYWAGSLRVRLRDLRHWSPGVGFMQGRDTSSIDQMPGDQQDYSAFLQGLPVYVPREIPLLPATGGKLDMVDEKK